MTTCKSCGTLIQWVETEKAKRMPVEKRVGGNIILRGETADQVPIARVVGPGKGTHVSHFANCKQADLWRN